MGHGHSLQPGLIWHKQGSRALHRAPLSASMGSLSSAGNSHHLPRRSGGVGGRGRKVGLAQSPGWPQRQSSLSPPHHPSFSPHTHSGLTFSLAICLPVSSLIWPPKGPCTATEPYFSVAPTVLHLSGLLSPCLCRLGLFPSNLDQEILPGFSNHLPPPPCGPQHHRSLTNAGTSEISPGNSLAGYHIEVNFSDPHRDPAT